MDWVNGKYPEERIVQAIEDIVARYRRADRDNDFTAGRRVAYIDSLAVILGVSHQDVRQAIKEGVL